MYVSRCSALKNPATSETADVPPFLLVQINFCCAGCDAWRPRGASTPGNPPGAATAFDGCGTGTSCVRLAPVSPTWRRRTSPGRRPAPAASRPAEPAPCSGRTSPR